LRDACISRKKSQIFGPNIRPRPDNRCYEHLHEHGSVRGSMNRKLFDEQDLLDLVN
jgi:hypothetical protein